jgi:hypothetical protein
MAFSNHDVRPDTPINNFATWNPLFAVSSPLYEGNLYAYGTALGARSAFSTFEIPTTGKWYVEILLVAKVAPQCGIARSDATGSGSSTSTYGYYDNGATGSPFALIDGTSQSAASSPGSTAVKAGFNITAGNITRIYIDADKNKLWMGNNTNWATSDNTLGSVPTFGSGGTFNGSTPLNFADGYYIFVSNGNTGDKWFLNAGQDSTFGGNKIPTKVYTDSNGQGRFFYEPPVGALALCSRNIDNPKNVPSTYIVDETNNNMLTYNGNTAISKFSPYATDGYSVSIFSTNSFEIPIADVSFGTGDFSVEAWLYFRHDGSSDACILIDSRSGLSQSNLVLGLDGTYRNPYWYYSGGNVALSNATGACIPDNWNHVLWQRTGGYLKMYSNGVEIKSDSNTSDLSGTGLNSRARIGNLVSTPNYAIDSLMTDFRIVKGGVAYNITGSTYTVPTSKLLSSQGSSNGEIYSGTCSFLLSVDSNTIKDSSSSPSAITINNSPSIEAWSPYTSINKQTGFELPETTNGGSIKLDGSSGYISTSGDSVDFGTAGTPFTLEAWVYPTTATQGSYAGIVGSYSTAADNTGIDITATNGNNQFYSVHVGSGSSSWNQFNSVPKPYQWQHVAVTRDDSGNIRLFLDGVLDSKSDVQQSGDINSSNKQLRIGHFWGNQYYNGYITNVRLSNNVRYAASGNFTPSAQKFVSDSNTLFLYQPFQPKSSVNSSVFNITDSYNKGEANKNLTYFGNTKVVDFSPYKGGSHGSFSFDGTGDYLTVPDSDDWNPEGVNFTVEGWFYLTGTASGYLFGTGLVGGTEHLAIRVNADNTFNLYLRKSDNTSAFNANISAGFVRNKWNHVAVERYSDLIKVYVNGVGSSDTFNASGWSGYNSSSPLSIGAFGPYNAARWAGYIADFRFVKGTAVYTSNFTPPAFPLRADKYSTDGSDPSGGSNITGTVSLLLQPGKVADTDNEAAKDPDANFKAVTWTGQTVGVGGDATDKTGTVLTVTTGFQPDLVWAKIKSGTTGSHNLYDSLRVESNGNHNILYSNQNNKESIIPNGFQDIISTGFTLNETNGGGDVNGPINGSTSRTYCAWCWKAGGEPTANGKIKIDETESNISDLVTSTGASLTPTRISANTKAGFSIIKYVGQKTTTGSDTMPHGLNKAPEFLLMKSLDKDASWSAYTTHVAGGSYLDTTDAWGSARETWMTNNTDPTPSLITVGWNSNNVNQNGDDHIIYAWHSVPGFSKIGTYTGTGNSDGTFVYTGFKPAWVMARRTGTASWVVFDNARNSANPLNRELYADTDAAEDTSDDDIDFLSNGFKLRRAATNFNDASTQFYMAFAELPSSFARGR